MMEGYLNGPAAPDVATDLHIRGHEAAGYVERAPDETDRRAELIRLTMHGRKFRRDAYKVKR